MKSNSGDHDQSLSETAQLLGVEVTQDGLNSSADGSNAILLPGKKKGKSKDKGKASKKNVNKQVPVLGKSKQRKLKKLEEEKQNKLLQARSIKILEKCKVWDGAYSLLHSSGTIGQAETMKEKRRRAVQLSKAGIDVPEDILPFKNKNNQDVSEENEGTGMPDHHQSHQEKDCCDNSVLPTKKKERDDGRHSKSVGVHSITSSKVQVVVDVGTDVVPRTTVVTSKGISTCNLEDQKHSPFILSSSDKGHETNSKDKGADGSKIINQNMKVPPDLMVQKHVNAPIVVHVSRPVEVEEKRKDLPIIMMEQEIMEAINENSIVILCGETGCGKTTQVPQFLYEAGFGSSNRSDRKGIIGVTQPRRVAVLATAKRVSFELGLHLGKEVGFQVRHDKMIGDNCSIKFMTDGILLREVQSDFLLKRYSVIILDEAHERSLNTDILIGMLSRIIKLRQKLYAEQQEKILSGVKISPENFITQLKLVLMSATLRVEDFISNKKLFHEIPPVLEVPVRQFPVTVHFSKRTQQDYLGQAYKKVMSIHKRLPPGGILVFVTGQREVEFLCKKLQRASEQLNKKNSKKADNEITASSDVDMKEINEAFGMGSNSLDQQTDRFNFYEEDENNPDADCDLSDAESESELEVDSEDEDSVKYEAQENTGMVLDFLNDVESLSSLKASFEALAGNLSNQDCKEKPSLPDAPSLENGMEVAANSAGALYVLPLYAMLPASAQLRIFEEVPEGDRLVVVATNVAETSLTIPGIKYVVDTGKEKVKNYNYTNGMATFEVQWISKASAAQRAGRAGRTGPGHCYRLYSSAAFSKDDIFPDFSCPEISKIPVDGVVLLMKFMGIDKVANFPFPTPPETKALVEAELCLKALEALDSQGRLTPMGSAMAQYPMSPHHSRMLLTVIQIMRNQQGYARANFVLGYAVAAASALSFQNPFLMQFGENHGDNDDMDQEKSDTEKMKDQQERLRQKKAKAMAREARARLCNPSSDALTIAYALQLFELAENSVQFCKENSLHLKTMDEMSKLRKQLLQLIFYQSKFCEEFAWNHGTADDVELSWRIRSDRHPLLMNEEELLGQSLCAGWADRIAKRVRTVSESSENDGKVRAVRYQSCALKDTVYLHRWSSVSRSAPEFLVYTELLHTKRPYMHGVTSVKSDWLVKYASSLCTFSAPLTDPKPYYEHLSDQVFCWVSPTFGRHNWQLPLHSLRIKNDILRVSVFACALLEGQVLPCLRSIQKFLAAPPSSLLKPQALGQRRVGDLLSRLKTGSRTIDSRAKLRDAWSQDPLFLHSEIKYWFQERFHDRFGDIWEEMHHEVHLESCELFPKRAKKEKKKVK